MSEVDPTRESWRAIPGYEGWYEVSNVGRVRSVPRTIRGGHRNCRIRRRGKMLSLEVAKPSGHLKASLSKQGRRRNWLVNRLVLLAFVGDDARLACHHNDEPADNRLENLYYGTHKDNAQDSIRLGTFARGERSGTAKLTADKVMAMRAAYAAGGCQRVLARRFGVDKSHVSEVVRGIKWAHLPLVMSRRSKNPIA